MTLYYSLVFVLLVTEMILFCLLVLPLPLNWRRSVFSVLSKSTLVARLQYGLKITFIFVFILFVDSVNRMWRVQEEASHQDHHIHDVRTDTNFQARKFYSQRNMYLTGFTLFLSLILNRTYVLVLTVMRAEEQLENLKKETNRKPNGDLQKRIEQLSQELESEKIKSENLKQQAKNNNDEYMQLADRNNELENKDPKKSR